MVEGTAQQLIEDNNIVIGVKYKNKLQDVQVSVSMQIPFTDILLLLPFSESHILLMLQSMPGLYSFFKFRLQVLMVVEKDVGFLNQNKIRVLIYLFRWKAVLLQKTLEKSILALMLYFKQLK